MLGLLVRRQRRGGTCREADMLQEPPNELRTTVEGGIGQGKPLRQGRTGPGLGSLANLHRQVSTPPTYMGEYFDAPLANTSFFS